MIACKVYRDLILLYVSGECSEETRELVEKHLTNCNDCNKYYKELTEPIENVKPESSLLEERVKDFEVKKSFKKIRKRWFITLVATILILSLLTGGGIMTYNQIRGENICFTSLDEWLIAKSYIHALKQGNYKKAFSYIDLRPLYDMVANDQSDNIPSFEDTYTKIIVGDDTLYVVNKIYINEYQEYLKNQDVTAFWASMLSLNDTYSGDVYIPEKQFDAARKLNEEKKGVSYHIHSNSDPNYYNQSDPFEYVKATTTWGEQYYIQTNKPASLIERFFNNTACLPASIHDKVEARWEKQHGKFSSCSDYYTKMGFDSYKERQLQAFQKRMKDLASKDIKIKDYSIGRLYYSKSIDTDPFWDIDVNITLVDGSTGIIKLNISKGSIKGISGYFSESDDANKLIDNLHMHEDVDGFYAAHGR
jgi:Predicted integral membrane protein